MRSVCFALSASFCCLLLLSAFVAAQNGPALNKDGVADKYIVNFGEPFRVGDALLPKGDYEITHTMQGDKHVMIFRQWNVDKPIEVSARCSLVKLSAPATETRKSYTLNRQKERVLKEMEVRGDLAKHVF